MVFLTSVPQGASQVALVVTNPPANAGDLRDEGSIPGSGRSPGEENGNLLQYSCLKNPMDRRAWQAMVHRVTKRHDWSDFTCTHHKSINNVYVDYIQLDIDLMSVFRQKMRRGRVLTFMNVNRIGSIFGPLYALSQRRRWHSTPVLLPGKSHGWRSLVGCSPWGLEELDTAEWLHFHFSLSCIGEGNGNPLQCSCLENPIDRGARRATVHGVTKSQTWLSD